MGKVHIIKKENDDLPIPEIREYSIQERSNGQSLEDLYNIQKRAADTLQPALEERESKLKEFLNVLVNGDEISQLFINSELTEKAREELIKLQQDAANSAKINMNNLREEIKDLEKRLKELEEECNNFEEKKEKLTEDVESLKMRKSLLTQSMISDLNLMKASLASYLKDDEKKELDWIWKVEEWVRPAEWGGYSEPYGVKLSEFDSYIENHIKKYSDVVGCSLDEAKEQFYALSPKIKDLSEWVKKPENVSLANMTFNDAITDHDDLNILFYSIYYPRYAIVKINNKTR